MSAWGKTGYYDDQGRWVNPQDPTGFAMGTPQDNAPGGNPGAMPNNEWNKFEAKKLYDAAMGWKPSVTATHAGPVSINRDPENATNAMQMAQLARMQIAASGNAPTVAGALGQGAHDAAIRAQMGAGKGGGALAARGIVGAGSGMYGDNAGKYGAMAGGEQQAAYGALLHAAAGARGQSLAGDIDQANINQQLAMTNAGADQAVALANQKAQQQAFNNQLGAAGTYGGLVQDAFAGDLGYRDHLLKASQHEQAKRDHKNKQTAAQAGQGIDTFAKILTFGMGSAGQSNAASATPTGTK